MNYQWMTDLREAGDMFYPSDIAEALKTEAENLPYEKGFIPTEDELKECEQALYRLHTLCENRMNDESFRTFYKTLASVSSAIKAQEFDKKRLVKDEDIPELKGCIVDILEDYMEENDIYVPNEERELREAEEGMCAEQSYLIHGTESDEDLETFVSKIIGEAGMARIYGSDYEEIAYRVDVILHTTGVSRDMAAAFIYDSYINILSKNSDIIISGEVRNLLKEKIIKTLMSYGY